MAAQTKTQRQAAAKKAAADPEAKTPPGRAVGNRQGFRSPDEEFRAGHRTRRAHDRQAGRQRNRTSRRGRDDAPGAVAHQAERAVLIPVGATLEARDRVTDASAPTPTPG